nr:hypothetical protein BaRGS_014584 [Batillaria attramentaria]
MCRPSLHTADADLPRIEVTCKSTVDLEKTEYDAGLLVSRLPDRIPIYASEDEHCDIYVSIPINWELMFYFDMLDLGPYDQSLGCASTSLQLFDGGPNQIVQGLDRLVCGHKDEMPRDLYFVYRNFFIIRVNALSSIMGSGFRIHFTRYRRARIEVTCKSMVDLENMEYDAGLLVSRLPDKIPIYANEDERCDIYVSIPINWELMFYFDWLDLYAGDVARCDTTSIALFDGSPNQPVQGLDRLVCGHEDEMPRDVYFVFKNFFIIRVNALSSIMGSGFRIHFTRYRRALPCSTDEFTCDTYGSPRCIAEHLVCDQWNDCGDWLDEERDCPDIAPGAIAGLVVAIIIIIAVVIGLIIFCHIRKRRERVRMEKEEYMMRESSSGTGRGLMSPFTVSGESMEKKEPYQPRYNSKRNSGRGGRNTPEPDAPEYEEYPPPYTEKPQPSEDSRSEEAAVESDDDAPRVRRKSRRARESVQRESTPDDVFDDAEDLPRVRRPKSRNVDERTPSKADLDRSRDERAPPRAEPERNLSREDPDRSRDERYPTRDEPDKSRDDRYAPREDRYPSRRDQRDSPRDEGYPPRDDRYPSRRDDRDSPRDDRYAPRDDRYPTRDDRYPSRRDDRDSPRDDRYAPRDDRYPPRDDRYPSRRDDRDSPYDDRYPPRDDRYSRRDDRYPPRDDRYPSRRDDRDPRDRRSTRRDDPRMADDHSGSDDQLDQLHPLREQKRRSMHSDPDSDTPLRDERRPSPGDRYRDDDRPRRGRDERPSSSRNDTPTSRRDRDDRENDREEDRRRNRPSTRDSQPPVESPNGVDDDDEDAPRRRRRRRSRSRDGQENGRRSRSNMPPVQPVYMDSDSPRQSRQPMGYREESV